MADHLSPESLPQITGSYRQDAVLANSTWFNVGGPAEILFRPKDVEDLAHFLANKPNNVTITVLGVGSNLLVRDGGIDGIVIKLGRGFTDVTASGNTITAGAAALCFNTARFAADYNISGLEFLCGIPGTIGGALAMNAGAYGNDVSSTLIEAKLLDETGNLHIMSCSDIGYIYRGNTLPEGFIFVSGTFRGQFGNKGEIEAKMQSISNQRAETQPIKSKTGGSTFKNPAGPKKAWELIDEAGCRGMKLGGAQVSEKHCNFFINTGNATAADIENLGEKVKKLVKEKTGTDLQWEIKIIGKK